MEMVKTNLDTIDFKSKLPTIRVDRKDGFFTLNGSAMQILNVKEIENVCVTKKGIRLYIAPIRQRIKAKHPSKLYRSVNGNGSVIYRFHSKTLLYWLSKRYSAIEGNFTLYLFHIKGSPQYRLTIDEDEARTSYESTRFNILKRSKFDEINRRIREREQREYRASLLVKKRTEEEIKKEESEGVRRRFIEKELSTYHQTSWTGRVKTNQIIKLELEYKQLTGNIFNPNTQCHN
jgi:predicted nucleotidyltransferase